MSLDYNTVNISSLIGHPDEVIVDMRRAILDRILTGESKQVLIEGVKFKIESLTV